MHQPQIRLHLLEVRTELGLTLRAVEERTGKEITKSLLQRAEAGKCDLTLRRLLCLADTYQRAPWMLVDFPGWPCPPPCACACHAAHEECPHG